MKRRHLRLRWRSVNAAVPVLPSKHNRMLYANWPHFWPVWVGGDKNFMDEGQPFHLVDELRRSTMLEF